MNDKPVAINAVKILFGGYEMAYMMGDKYSEMMDILSDKPKEEKPKDNFLFDDTEIKW